MNFEFKFDSDKTDDVGKRQEEYKNRLYDKYTTERDSLNKTALEIGGRYDKAIFLLGGGSLALSITFIEKIAPHPTILGIVFLVAAWFLLLTSLVLLLFATSNSQNAIQQQIIILDSTYAPLFDDAGKPSSDVQVPDNPYLSKIKRQDWWCLRLLVAGLACLCVFAVVNVPLVKDASTTIQPASFCSYSTIQREASTGAPSGRGNLSSTNELATPSSASALKSSSAVQSQTNGSPVIMDKHKQPTK